MGQMAAEYTYDSFGNRTQTGSLTQRYGFTGREVDDESGLLYFRARHYDPTLGQFIQRDPIGFAGGDLNLYAYVWNDPLNYTDPSGLSASLEGRVLFGGVSGFAAGQAIRTAIAYCLKSPFCRNTAAKATLNAMEAGVGALDEALGLGSPDGTTTPPSASGGPIGSIFSGIFAMVDKITEKLGDIARSVPNEGATGGGDGPGPDDGDGGGDDDGSEPPAKEPKPIGTIEHPDGSTEIIWDPPLNDGPLTTGEIQPDPLPPEQPEAPIWWRIINLLGGGDDL